MRPEPADQNSSQREIKEKEKRFQLIFENNSSGIFLIDKSGKYITANPAYTQITGYTTKEMILRPVGNLIHLNDQQRLLAALQSLLSIKQERYNDECQL